MKVDTIKAFSSYAFAFTTMGMAYYGLVLLPFELDPLVKGALIGWASAAIAFVFGQEIAKATSANASRAYAQGLAMPTPPTTTVTTSEGPPATSTTTTTAGTNGNGTKPPVAPEEGNG